MTRVSRVRSFLRLVFLAATLFKGEAVEISIQSFEEKLRLERSVVLWLFRANSLLWLGEFSYWFGRFQFCSFLIWWFRRRKAASCREGKWRQWRGNLKTLWKKNMALLISDPNTLLRFKFVIFLFVSLMYTCRSVGVLSSALSLYVFIYILNRLNSN